MRFRETAKIQTVLAGGKIWFRRDTGYRITLANGTVKQFKPKDLKAMSETDFISNVLEMDVSKVTLLETEDRRTPPRFAPKSKERAAEIKARKDRIRKRAARRAARNSKHEAVEINLATAHTEAGVDAEREAAELEASERNTMRIVREMAAEMGVRLLETPEPGETA